MNDCYKGVYVLILRRGVVLMYTPVQNTPLDNIYSIPTHSLIFYGSTFEILIVKYNKHKNLSQSTLYGIFYFNNLNKTNYSVIYLRSTSLDYSGIRKWYMISILRGTKIKYFRNSQ